MLKSLDKIPTLHVGVGAQMQRHIVFESNRGETSVHSFADHRDHVGRVPQQRNPAAPLLDPH